MKLKEAFLAMKQHKKTTIHTDLSTPFSENMDDDHVLEEYPRPQLVRSYWRSLNGWWDYAFTKNRTYPSSMDGHILVPFSPEAPLSHVKKRLLPGSFLWYEQNFSFHEADLAYFQKGYRLLLHFGGVDQMTSLWCNHHFAGRHRGGYLPFSFDVTSFIKDYSLNLTLRVEDYTDTSFDSRGKQTLAPGGMFYTPQSGIWQTVWWEWVPQGYIESLKITPDYDQSQVEIEIFCKGSLSLEEITVSVSDKEQQLLRCSQHSNKFLLSLRDFHPWSPEDPFLYQLQVQVGDDFVESYFAMRKFSIGKDEAGIPRIYINNKPYFQNGVLDQGYWPDGLYTAPSDAAMIYDIQTMKDLGFNMIRKHIKIEPLRWYYHCDRLGMLVWQDMVNGGGRSYLTFLCYLPTALPFITSKFSDSHYKLFSRSDRAGRRLFLKETKATIALLYNCPCICTWVPFNEGWGQFDAAKVSTFIRKLDSTRLIDHASGWYDQHCGDLKSVHNYFRRLKVKKDFRPFVISEYGGLVYRVEDHCYSSGSYGYGKCKDQKEFVQRFGNLQQQLLVLEKKGLCAAVYTQVSDVEEETNGILTYDRKICKLHKKPV